MSTYLYGIIRHKPTSTSFGVGVGDPPRLIRSLRFRSVVAVVSNVDADQIGEAAGIRALRRDMAAHSQALSRVLESRAVLPCWFGIVFPEDRVVVDELLAPQHDELLARLDTVDGAIEVALTATFVEEQVLREVVEEQPELLNKSAGAGVGYSRRVELGSRLAAAISSKRDAAAEWMIQRLAPLSRQVVIADGVSELTVLRASFLVAREQLDRFDRSLDRLRVEAGDSIQFSCVGPLPPYSFVDMRIRAGARQ